jgi:hypothetical protein
MAIFGLPFVYTFAYPFLLDMSEDLLHTWNLHQRRQRSHNGPSRNQGSTGVDGNVTSRPRGNHGSEAARDLSDRKRSTQATTPVCIPTASHDGGVAAMIDTKCVFVIALFAFVGGVLMASIDGWVREGDCKRQHNVYDCVWVAEPAAPTETKP